MGAFFVDFFTVLWYNKINVGHGFIPWLFLIAGIAGFFIKGAKYGQRN